jgi:ATP/ADP translocase
MKKFVQFYQKPLKIFHPSCFQSTNYVKTIAFALLLFFSLLHVNIVRVFKDTFSIVDMGIYNVGIIKGMLEVPFSILVIYLYNKLSKKFNNLTCFLLITGFFITFFCWFGWIFYLKQQLNIPNFQDTPLFIENKNTFIQSKLYFVLIKLPYICLYLFGEVWVVVLYSFLIWSFIHTKTSENDVTQNYTIYNSISQSSIIVSGFILSYVRNILNISMGLVDIQTMSLLILITGLIIVLFYLFIYFYFPSFSQNIKEQQGQSYSFSMEYYSLLSNNKNIRKMFYIVLCCGLSMTLLHLLWFQYLQVFYENNISSIINVQGYLNYYTGGITLSLCFISKLIFRTFQWKFLSLLVPMLCGIFSILFLLFLWFNTTNLSTNYKINHNLILIIGSIYYIMSRSLKYTIFDIAKEIFFSYYKKNQEVLTKGKSLIDVIAFKLGKSTGALCITLFSFTHYITLSFSYFILTFVMLVIYYIWISSINKINK